MIEAKGGPEGRINMINQWAAQGAHSERTLFDHEREFRRSITDSVEDCFQLHKMSDEGDPKHRAQISHLVNSIDLYPNRIGDSFVSCWRALEIELKRGACCRGDEVKEFDTAAPALRHYLKFHTDPELVQESWNLAPLRAFGVLANRLGDGDGKSAEQKHEIDSPFNSGEAAKALNNKSVLPTWSVVKEGLKKARGEGGDGANRRASDFLRSHLTTRGNSAAPGQQVEYEPASAPLLYFGLVYAVRNDLTHGSLQAHTFKKDASIKDYPVPLFCLNVTYASLCLLWADRYPTMGLDKSEIIDKATDSLRCCQNTLGSAWA